MGSINVAIIGVGNCASSLVQGINKYSEADPEHEIPGIMNTLMSDYHIGDIKIVAAFDIDKENVGKDLSEAISALISKAPGETSNIVKILKEKKVDVVINYLPVGSEQATKWYVEQVLKAGCAFVNCIPVFIAKENYCQKRFHEAGLPIIGDDIKSQVGATIIHRVLARLFQDRGVKINNTYQLNFGGNTDFLNMLERDRLISKKISKTESVKSQLEQEINSKNIHIGPSDHVPWLEDRKWAYIRLEGTSFGDLPLNAEIKLEVEDSPNSAGVAVDAIRCAKIAKDRGITGPVDSASSYFMKSPPKQFTDDEARQMVEEFVNGNEKKQTKTRLDD